MSETKFQPLTSFTKDSLFGESGDEMKIKYITGQPRNYNFDAGKGKINLGDVQITKSMEAFSFTPVAYRLFKDSLFQKRDAPVIMKEWVEFFFLNEAFQLSVISFSGFSALAFMQHYTKELYYEGLTPCDVIFTVMPQARFNKTANASYTVAGFASKKANNETIKATRFLNEVIAEIYRHDTFKPLVANIESQNYKLSPTKASENMRLLEEDASFDALIREFNQPTSVKVAAFAEAA
jgi:hypothetical protein